MDDAGRRLWWKAAGVALFAFAAGAAFSAYLRPDMLILFGDLMSCCASLIR